MRHLALGEFFTNIGNAILLLAFAKFLYDETGQLWAFSFAFIIEMVLALFVPMMAGRVIDTKGVKDILRFASAANLLICLSYALMVTDSQISVVVLLLASMVLSIVKLVLKLSVFSLTPELSDDKNLEKNNGWLASALQGGQLLGMVLAAFLLTHGSQSLVFAVSSVFFLFAWVCYTLSTCGLQHKVQQAIDVNPRESIFGTINEQFKVSRKFAPLLLISNLDFSVVAMFNLLLAATVANLFDNDPKWLSILDGAFAIAALLGGMLVAKKLRCSSIFDSIRTQVFFLGCLFILLFPNIKYSLLICTFAFGVSLSLSTVFWNTMLQRNFPAEFKGSLAGARNLISSIYIGVCSIVVSFLHEMGFSIAVVACIAITTINVLSFLIFNYKDSSKRNIEIQGDLS
ncbi:MFS transporter [Sinobacterium caligoides]|uniref:MFS transporter n=1 Tax=Sinobacterium caligoides TaxID=933926 RepID=A0A3N2E0G2_9GAMM|nr:MFS transporter [Sinobacterium caligoides]ROS05507.1 MFS transporter [Sinobacterium caligoides]